MKRKYHFPILFCLLAVLPVCRGLGLLLDKPFVVTSELLFYLLLSGAVTGLTCAIQKGGVSNAPIWILPLSLICCITIWLTSRHFAGFLCAGVLLVCGWVVFKLAPKGWKKTLCRILCLLVTMALLLLAPLWLFAATMGTSTTVLELDSPDGRYTAVVTDVDSGALGGDTLVDVRDNKRTVNLLVGSFVSSLRVYEGPWGQWQNMELSWHDEKTLRRDDILYSVSPEDIAFMEALSDTLGMRLTNGAVLAYEDTHGGFHGDGHTFAKIRLSGQVPGWNALPMTKNLTLAFYGGMDGELLIGSLFRDAAGEPLLPPVENGWYFFQDRHSESTDPKDDTALFSRSSWNFTAAVFDADTNLLYYFELDT